MECLEFWQLLLLLCNNLKDSDIPHCTKMRELVLQAWRDYFAALKANLKKATGEISFTSDLWSADNLDSYLAMTAHWIG
ncbi:hypothetical protein SCLCIDRAFT_122302 [Scleroderma citrinum Foug A]|uniref:Uncharacterized protein n=1 Tax=Scleroderma citrinum Foug A TaxID=1036808 RepID=A0A0C3DYP3_9AGAM|nr:hypothetical protein SCLCIDRAFT_122302 [Scleroderma citrinum Foug A]